MLLVKSYYVNYTLITQECQPVKNDIPFLIVKSVKNRLFSCRYCAVFALKNDLICVFASIFIKRKTVKNVLKKDRNPIGKVKNTAFCC